MDRKAEAIILAHNHRVPHGCGDGPGTASASRPTASCSPRVWGWTELAVMAHRDVLVFPTGVGMDRCPGSTCPTPASVPHGCGDGPTPPGFQVDVKTCSPRVWGWTDTLDKSAREAAVFPTGVGMDRLPLIRLTGRTSVPHGCGDGPSWSACRPPATWCSPRVWGWTSWMSSEIFPPNVFPTGVGMDRCCPRHG